ncbi:MAG: YafY family transcriptional regulator [Xanthomonadaceae bacterium]|jgi:predicted DNA-binding transcriptional regulator YafY|nr:YafY family transcriptional regulator [Xanthomonadaceae bacterium]
MDRYERILALHRILKSARLPVTLQRLMDELGCSRATLYRDLAFLRDGLGAPLEGGEGEARFRYDAQEADRFELPGLWLSSEELHALMAAQQLLDRTGPGVLSAAIAPLRTRIDALLQQHAGGRRWPIERIRVLGSGTRRIDEAVFRMVASGVLERRRLRFEYLARSTNTRTLRQVSPQRLTHYRGNWYLDAFDHEREALRSFAVDRIRHARIEADAATDFDDAGLDAHLATSYGIFAGAPKAWATIRFSAKAARWVADEHWHSRQEGRMLPDGRYELRVPYGNARELLMDVLRHGPDAEVLEPPALREQLRSLLHLTAANYGG